MAVRDTTYKLGIRFTGWSERPGFESYFHPFPAPTDLHSEPGFLHDCMLTRRGVDVPAHPDDWFIAKALADARKAPQPHENFPFPLSYWYHFDGYKLGAILRDWAVKQGVDHKPLSVEEVGLAADGDVAALLSEGGARNFPDYAPV